MSKPGRCANNIARTRKIRGDVSDQKCPESAKRDIRTTNQNKGFLGVHPPFTWLSETISALLNRRRRRAYARSAQAQRCVPIWENTSLRHWFRAA